MPDFMDSLWSYAVSVIAFWLYAAKGVSVELKRVWYMSDFRAGFYV
jgi:hypothetical protein